MAYHQGDKRIRRPLTYSADGSYLVEQLNGLLEAGELHHGVRDLATPQRDQALVEGAYALVLHHLGPRLAQRVREPGHGLDAHLRT